MKIAIINFSGNVGKTTVADCIAEYLGDVHVYAVETINAGTMDGVNGVEHVKGKRFSELQSQLIRLHDAVVDVGASNVEDFIKLMGQFHGSHEDFDLFLVPVTKERKQQLDTISTIKTLSGLGVPADKIHVVFNRVDVGEAETVSSDFRMIFGFYEDSQVFTLNEDAVIFSNDVFPRLKSLKVRLSDLLADNTDYRAVLREATDEDEKDRAVRMISAKRLAISAKRNLDDVYSVLFN